MALSALFLSKKQLHQVMFSTSWLMHLGYERIYADSLRFLCFQQRFLSIIWLSSHIGIIQEIIILTRLNTTLTGKENWYHPPKPRWFGIRLHDIKCIPWVWQWTAGPPKHITHGMRIVQAEFQFCMSFRDYHNLNPRWDEERSLDAFIRYMG